MLELLAVEGSYGKVAKKFGVTREEVCHYVTIVKRLPPEVVVKVEAEREEARVRRLNLRTLLKIANMPTIQGQSAAFACLQRSVG